MLCVYVIRPRVVEQERERERERQREGEGRCEGGEGRYGVEEAEKNNRKKAKISTVNFDVLLLNVM